MSRPAATAKHRARTRSLVTDAARLGVLVELGTSRRYGGFATYSFKVMSGLPQAEWPTIETCHGIQRAELFLKGLQVGRHAKNWPQTCEGCWKS